MRLIARKPCCFEGRKYFIGEEVPLESVANPKAQEKMGVLSLFEENGPECRERVSPDSLKIFVPIKRKDKEMELPLKCEDLRAAVNIMQMSVKDATEAIENITEESILIFLNACDSRKGIKEETEARAAELTGSRQEESAGDQ